MRCEIVSIAETSVPSVLVLSIYIQRKKVTRVSQWRIVSAEGLMYNGGTKKAERSVARGDRNLEILGLKMCFPVFRRMGNARRAAREIWLTFLISASMKVLKAGKETISVSANTFGIMKPKRKCARL